MFESQCLHFVVVIGTYHYSTCVTTAGDLWQFGTCERQPLQQQQQQTLQQAPAAYERITYGVGEYCR